MKETKALFSLKSMTWAIVGSGWNDTRDFDVDVAGLVFAVVVVGVDVDVVVEVELVALVDFEAVDVVVVDVVVVVVVVIVVVTVVVVVPIELVLLWRVESMVVLDPDVVFDTNVDVDVVGVKIVEPVWFCPLVVPVGIIDVVEVGAVAVDIVGYAVEDVEE